MHIGNGLFKIAETLEGAEQPEWAIRMEQMMTDASDALARLNENIDGLTTEVGEIADVLANLPTSEDPAIAAGINEAADRLTAVKDALENATTLDDPAVEPPVEEPTPEEPPVDEQPGDQPPVDQPPTV
jgi:predicted trehalose synthase